MVADKDKYRKAKFFREDEDRDLSDKTSPSPDEWFGGARQKYKIPTFEFSSHMDPYEGWRAMFRKRTSGPGSPLQYAPPMENPMLPPETKEDIRFKDNDNDLRSLVYVLEQAAEIFEEDGHIDLAAECENICELIAAEEVK